MSDAAGSYEWATYFVISGVARPSGEVAQALSSLSPGNSESAKTYQLGQQTVTAGGLRGEAELVECVWLRGRFVKLSQADQREIRTALQEVSTRLSWKIEIRRALSSAFEGLPPRLDVLMTARRNRPDVAWLHNPRITRWVIFVLFATLIVWSALPRGGRQREMCADLFIFLLLLVVISQAARSLPSRGMWNRIRHIAEAPAFFMACALIIALVTPPWPINILVIAVLALLFGIHAWWMKSQDPLKPEAELLRETMRYAMGSEHVVIDAGGQPACLVCDYDLRELKSCRCPECGTMNYHLTDRADARALADEHGARWVA